MHIKLALLIIDQTDNFDTLKIKEHVTFALCKYGINIIIHGLLLNATNTSLVAREQGNSLVRKRTYFHTVGTVASSGYSGLLHHQKVVPCCTIQEGHLED
jgi:hypothetical protein